MNNEVPTAWRKSSYSTGTGNCVEVALLANGTIGVRDSKNPNAGMAVFARAAMATWIKGCKAGDRGTDIGQ